MLSEDILQAEIFKWYHNNYCLPIHTPRHYIFSVPNGGLRNKREAVKMKATGLKAGVSDLIILQPNKAIFVEVKTETGRQSDKQKAFQVIVSNLGFEYHVVRSLEEFKEKIYPYLESL